VQRGPTEAVDPVAVLAALGLSEPDRVEPVPGGADAAIWRVERAGVSYALRLLRPDQTDQARREAAALATAAAADLPVPPVVAAGRWRDRPALLLAWSPGRSLALALQERPLDLPLARALGLACGREQAAIHALPVPPELRDHPVPWPAWAGPDPALRACLAALPARPPALLHLDYHPLNVLVDGGRVTAVLDWANARAGDPRADLARTLSILRLAPRPRGASGAVAWPALRAFEVGWRRGYRQAAGPVGGLAPFCWWAGLVMERDLAPRVGRTDLPWLTPAFLERVRRWTAGWRVRAGCAR
jgi:aminoglycoside phosphotransferase (APT) family kinase protein